MRAPKIFSTSSFRAAIATLIALNVWVGVRLPELLQESSIDDVLELERRIERLPSKERVAVLVLGNSHAIDSLRPAVLAHGLGLQRDQVFNLAVAGSSPGEMRLLLERHLPRFPAVKRVICGVDAIFLGAGTNYRTRFLTRCSPAERWRYTLTWQHGLEARWGTMAAMAAPAADFNGPLRDAFWADPARTVRRLVRDEARPGSHQALTAAMRYAGGIPPERSRHFRRLVNMEGPPHPREMRAAAEGLAACAAGIGPGLEELAGLSDYLAGRGLVVDFVHSPVNEGLLAMLTQAERERYADYEARVAEGLANEGRPLTRSPGPWPRRYFYDQAHMTEAGAAAFSAWLCGTWAKAPGRPS